MYFPEDNNFEFKDNFVFVEYFERFPPNLNCNGMPLTIKTYDSQTDIPIHCSDITRKSPCVVQEQVGGRSLLVPSTKKVIVYYGGKTHECSAQYVSCHVQLKEEVIIQANPVFPKCMVDKVIDKQVDKDRIKFFWVFEHFIDTILSKKLEKEIKRIKQIYGEKVKEMKQVLGEKVKKVKKIKKVGKFSNLKDGAFAKLKNTAIIKVNQKVDEDIEKTLLKMDDDIKRATQKSKGEVVIMKQKLDREVVKFASIIHTMSCYPFHTKNTKKILLKMYRFLKYGYTFNYSENFFAMHDQNQYSTGFSYFSIKYSKLFQTYFDDYTLMLMDRDVKTSVRIKESGDFAQGNLVRGPNASDASIQDLYQIYRDAFLGQSKNKRTTQEKKGDKVRGFKTLYSTLYSFEHSFLKWKIHRMQNPQNMYNILRNGYQKIFKKYTLCNLHEGRKRVDEHSDFFASYKWLLSHKNESDEILYRLGDEDSDPYNPATFLEKAKKSFKIVKEMEEKSNVREKKEIQHTTKLFYCCGVDLYTGIIHRPNEPLVKFMNI